MKTFSGFTEKTAENLLLDSGAFFKNYDIKTDTFESAVDAGKLIGATRDGGEFSAVPEIRQINVDGVKGRAKGLETLDSWDVYIKANVLEVNEDTTKYALVSAEVSDSENTDYKQIKAKNNIALADYIDNITWVGTLSGSDKPVIIQIYNALNTDGLKLTVKDKSEGVIAMTFYGHYSQADLDTPPFKIYYPKANTDNESM